MNKEDELDNFYKLEDSTTETENSDNVAKLSATRARIEEKKSLFGNEYIPSRENECVLPNKRTVTEATKKTIWSVVGAMMTPLEYLLFVVNIVFLLDAQYEYSYIQRAANLLQSAETIAYLNTMTELQLMILLFFAIKLSLTASSYIGLELLEEEIIRKSQTGKNEKFEKQEV